MSLIKKEKNNGQREHNLASSYIESLEVGGNDPLAPYRPHIDNFDLTDEQKLELLNVITRMADIILDVRFSLIKQPHILQKPVDDNTGSSNGVRHEN